MRAEQFSRTSSHARLILAFTFWLSCLIILLPGSLLGQDRPIVSSEIAVSSAEATLRVDFADNGELVIAFRDGTVTVDGEAVGSFSRGDALDSSWRALLGQAIAAEGAELSALLRGWQPPADAEGDAPDAIASSLESRLTVAPAPPAAQDPPAADAPTGLRQLDGAILGQLLGRPDRLRELTGAIEDLSLNGVRVHVGEDITIASDEVVRGTLLVVDGDADLFGRVEGNVVMLGGTLNLNEGSSVTGDVRWSDGRVTGARDVVDGRIRRAQVTAPPAAAPAPREVRSRPTPSRTSFNPLRYIGRGIAGLFSNLITFAILAVIGFGIIHFAGDKLDVVARTAQRSPARSAAVGFAAMFLFIPVWVLGIIALAITIIGIPVILAWLPLFPLALALAMVFGYMAVALNIGEWIAAQRFEKLPWLRVSNPFMAIVAGVGVLLAPYVVANVIQMGGPWLRAMQGLFSALGVIAGVIVVTVGLGAVLISRGGRRRDFAWIIDPDSDPDPMDWTEPRTSPAGGGPTSGGGPGWGATGAAGARAGAGGTSEPAPGAGATGSTESATHAPGSADTADAKGASEPARARKSRRRAGEEDAPHSGENETPGDADRGSSDPEDER